MDVPFFFQSRQLAQAASDLRDLIRQRLDKDSFVRRNQQAALESRLLNIEPRPATRPKKRNNPPPTTPEGDTWMALILLEYVTHCVQKCLKTDLVLYNLSHLLLAIEMKCNTSAIALNMAMLQMKK